MCGVGDATKEVAAAFVANGRCELKLEVGSDKSDNDRCEIKLLVGPVVESKRLRCEL